MGEVTGGTCPEWTLRTDASATSGVVSGVAPGMSGVSVSRCPESGPDATPDTWGRRRLPMSGEGGFRDGRGRSPSDRTDTLPAPIPDGVFMQRRAQVSVARSPAGDTSVCVVGNVPVTPVPWDSEHATDDDAEPFDTPEDASA